jgi:hypothetical protein
MKSRKELDVDLIGGAKPLTKEEEKKISDAIRKLKTKKKVIAKTTKKTAVKKKETA